MFGFKFNVEVKVDKFEDPTLMIQQDMTVLNGVLEAMVVSVYHETLVKQIIASF